LPNVETPLTMLETPVFEASAPLTWGAEGIFLPTEEIRISPAEEILNNSATLMVAEQTLNMETNHNSDFNTLPSALNTPEITDFAFDGKFDEFFTWNDFGNEAMKTFETPMNEPFTIDTDFSQPEEIWGFKTFNDDDDFGICAPPSIVEGTIVNENVKENLMHVEPPLKPEVEEFSEATFEIENNDVLKWIIDDQQIDDLPILNNSQVEPTPVIHNAPLALTEPSATTTFFLEELPLTSQPIKIDVKTEDLREDEKYRKMRSQNNEASKKCRMNRKRKQQDMEEECELLQERNVFLKSRLEEMEQEVKAWKKKLLSDIANNSTNSFQL